MLRADRLSVGGGLLLVGIQMAAVSWINFGEGDWIWGTVDAMLASWWIVLVIDVWKRGVE